MMVACSAACSAEPKPPSGADSGMSLAEVGEALIGVWRSKAPPSGGSWTDEGCRITEWIECDLVEFVLNGWTEQLPDQQLYAAGPPPWDQAEMFGTWFRARCPLDWGVGQVGEVARRRDYGGGAYLNDDAGQPIIYFRGFYPGNINAQAAQSIRCEVSAFDELECGWAPNSELGYDVDPTDRLVLERADPATEAPLCDELLERYLLSTRSPPPWHER